MCHGGGVESRVAVGDAAAGGEHQRVADGGAVGRRHRRLGREGVGGKAQVERYQAVAVVRTLHRMVVGGGAAQRVAEPDYVFRLGDAVYRLAVDGIDDDVYGLRRVAVAVGDKAVEGGISIVGDVFEGHFAAGILGDSVINCRCGLRACGVGGHGEA